MLLVGVVAPSLLGASNKSEQQQAIQRVEKAVAKTNLFELPSFEMKAVLQVVDYKGRLIEEGSYELMWNGPDRWREEIGFPDYHEVQIGGKGTIWVQRSLDFIPFGVHELRRALGFGSNEATALVQTPIRSGDTVKHVRQRKEHGEKLTCFEIEGQEKFPHVTCVNDTTETIVRDPSWNLDENLQPVGEKVFPRSLSALRLGKTIAKVNIGEIKTPVQFPPSAFTPSAGFASRPGCMNPLPPTAVKKQAPQYPETARMGHYQGTVFLMCGSVPMVFLKFAKWSRPQGQTLRRRAWKIEARSITSSNKSVPISKRALCWDSQHHLAAAPDGAGHSFHIAKP